MARVAILGAGAWGTAIGAVLAARLQVSLWAQNPAQAQTIHATRRNDRYLSGVELPKALAVTSDLGKAVDGARLVLVATPVAGLRDVLQRLDPPLPVIWLCKGFEEGTGLLPHQIAAETLGEQAKFGALSGPSFAEEVARGLPCALTLASGSASFAKESAALLHGGRMRIYYSADLVGVEIGGAGEKVMAVPPRTSHGPGPGPHPRAPPLPPGPPPTARPPPPPRR